MQLTMTVEAETDKYAREKELARLGSTFRRSTVDLLMVVAAVGDELPQW